MAAIISLFHQDIQALAFASAEFLRREYWNVSPWIGIAGYAVATGTGNSKDV